MLFLHFIPLLCTLWNLKSSILLNSFEIFLGSMAGANLGYALVYPWVLKPLTGVLTEPFLMINALKLRYSVDYLVKECSTSLLILVKVSEASK